MCALRPLYYTAPVCCQKSKLKEKKRKKGKNTIFTQGSQLSAIVAVLSRMKKRRKGFLLEDDEGVRSLRVAWAKVQKKREAVILGRVCPGEGVLVLLFLCVIPCSSHSLLLCLCCNVLLLCILLAGRARC